MPIGRQVAGYDIPRIRELAVRRGLADAATALSDEEVIDLTLVPGFSTSAAVTQIAGRGIGMDVVQKAVVDLRGTLDVDSLSDGGDHRAGFDDKLRIGNRHGPPTT